MSTPDTAPAGEIEAVARAIAREQIKFNLRWLAREEWPPEKIEEAAGYAWEQHAHSARAAIAALDAHRAAAGGGEWVTVPERFVVAVNEFLADWKKGDFSLSTLAALDAQSIVAAKEAWAEALSAAPPPPAAPEAEAIRREALEIGSTVLDGIHSEPLEYVLRRGYAAMGMNPNLAARMCRKLAECQVEDVAANAPACRHDWVTDSRGDFCRICGVARLTQVLAESGETGASPAGSGERT